MGHQVRYVLGFSLAGTILAFAIVGYLFSQGWIGSAPTYGGMIVDPFGKGFQPVGARKIAVPRFSL